MRDLEYTTTPHQRNILIQRINSFFKDGNIFKIGILYLLIDTPLSLIFSKLEELGIPNIHFHETIDKYNFSFEKELLLTVFFGPFVETVIFQFLPYVILSRISYLKKNPVYIILISTLLFGLTHNYSVHYIIYGMIPGAFYIYLYIMRTGKHPFYTVFILHAVNNLVCIILDKIFSDI